MIIIKRALFLLVVLLTGSFCRVHELSGQTAEKKQMVIATWLTPDHPLNRVALPAWIEKIKTTTNGRVEPKLEYIQIQTNPKNLFDDVEKGTYDASWSFHGYNPGRFRLTVMVELPLLGADAEAASYAYWVVSKKYFIGKVDEHKGLKLAALFAHPQGHIFMKEKISEIADVKGKKIRLVGGVQSEIGNAIGVSPISAPVTKLYEMITQGVADGAFMTLSELKSLKLSDVTKYIYIFPQGMYLGSFSAFVNPAFLDGLSLEDRNAIESTFGAELSASFGKAWEQGAIDGEQEAKSKGVTFVGITDADKKTFESIAKQIEDNWLKNVANKGINAKEALGEFRKTARGYKGKR